MIYDKIIKQLNYFLWLAALLYRAENIFVFLKNLTEPYWILPYVSLNVPFVLCIK